MSSAKVGLGEHKAELQKVKSHVVLGTFTYEFALGYLHSYPQLPVVIVHVLDMVKYLLDLLPANQ